MERPVATPEQWETQANGQRRESRPQQPGGGAHCQSRRWCGCQQRIRRGSSAAAHRPWLPWAPCCLAGRRGCLMAVGAAASSAGNAAAALRSAGTPIADDARLPGFCGCPAGASTLGRRRASPCKETWAYFTSHWTACRFNMPAQNARMRADAPIAPRRSSWRRQLGGRRCRTAPSGREFEAHSLAALAFWSCI